MLRPVVKENGKPKDKDSSSGESRREATRQRDLREVKAAIDKGYRNTAIDQFFKR